jgi:hypothetical protein
LGQILVQLIGQGGQNRPKPADSQKAGSCHFCRFSAKSKSVGADMPTGLMIEYHLLNTVMGKNSPPLFSSEIYVQNPTHTCMHCYERKPKVLVGISEHFF